MLVTEPLPAGWCAGYGRPPACRPSRTLPCAAVNTRGIASRAAARRPRSRRVAGPGQHDGAAHRRAAPAVRPPGPPSGQRRFANRDQQFVPGLSG